MIFDANVFRSIMEDPEQSIDVVRENVGYAPRARGFRRAACPRCSSGA